MRWLVSGRVQGVGFRYHVLQAARRLGVTGDVRNLRDGRVEVRARAADAHLSRLLEAVRQGPPSAQVREVEQQELRDAPEFDGFDVRFRASDG